MEDKNLLLRRNAIEKIISETQNMPGLLELMAVYGKLDELMLKSQEYLSIYQPKIISTSSNSSS